MGMTQKELNLPLLSESIPLIKRCRFTTPVKLVSRGFGIKYTEPWMVTWKRQRPKKKKIRILNSHLSAITSSFLGLFKKQVFHFCPMRGIKLATEGNNKEVITTLFEP